MKRSLRLTLLSVLLSLTLLTVLIVGLSGYLNLRSTASELTDQLLDQTAARVEERVERIVRVGERQAGIMQHLFDSGLLDPRDFRRLANYWYEVVESVPMMSALYFIRAEDGAGIFVVRSPEFKRVTIREVRPAAGGAGREVSMYSARDFRTRSFHEVPAVAARVAGMLGGSQGPLASASTLFPWPHELTRVTPVSFDLRTHPSFVAVREADGPTWTDTYLFFGERGNLSYPGFSYATPIRKPDGSLLGVMGVGFNVFSLCDFLKEVEVGSSGYPFIIEQRKTGELQLISHPIRGTIVEEQGEGLHAALIPINQVSDPNIPAFLAHLPAELDPATLQSLKPVRFEQGGQTWIGGYRGVQLMANAPRWVIGMVLPEDDVMGDARRHMRNLLAVAAGLLLLAGLLSVVTARQVARPLEDLARDAEAIGRLELDPRPSPRSFILEVDRLSVAAENMKTSLRSFRKYVPADLVSTLLRSGNEAVLGGERRRLTIYFSDIAGFTSISEAMEPEALVEHLGEYLQALSDQILASGGTVDKYIGDAIMAFWGAPVELPLHALAACTAAVRNQQTLSRMREKWKAQGKPPFEARIGINTGEVVVGNIGSAARLNYTVIGDAVNLASRLEGLNKYYGTHTLITEATRAEAGDGIVVRPLDWVSVKGKSKAILVHELLGLFGETPAETEDLAGLFGEGLHAYRRQEWALAMRRFEAVLGRTPDDAPAREMLRRCRAYQEQPPGPAWDGIHVMQSK